MNRFDYFRWLIIPLLFGTASCAALPGTGPSAPSMARSDAVEIVHVTPEVAAKASTDAIGANEAGVDRALVALRQRMPAREFRFGAGDVLNVTLWSFSPWPGGSGGSGGNPGAIALGNFTVSTDGAISLPYAGPVAIAGMTPIEAQQAISRRFADQRILQRPTAMVAVAASPHYDVMVTGSVGQPKAVGWTPAGLTLAQALTQSLGDGNAMLGQGDLSGDRATVQVSVLRGDAAAVDLPISVALRERIPLQAGDRVIVRKAPVVKVTVLGGGARKDGSFAFGRQPVLAEALAEASGLDGNAANDNAVFVMRRRAGDKPILYDFAWNRPQGLIAAQQFPLEDGDLVYIAEAPIVSIQKVVGLLFQVTLPAQVLK